MKGCVHKLLYCQVSNEAEAFICQCVCYKCCEADIKTIHSGDRKPQTSLFVLKNTLRGAKPATVRSVCLSGSCIWGKIRHFSDFFNILKSTFSCFFSFLVYNL